MNTAPADARAAAPQQMVPPAQMPPSHNRFSAPAHGATELLDPSFVPLELGRTMTPFSAPHPHFAFKPIKWYWLPAFRFDLLFLLSVLAFLFYLAATLVLILAPTAAGKAGGGIFLFLVASIITYVVTNIIINQTLRTAICRCSAKKEEAIRLWEARSHQHHSIYEKDVFHEEKTFFFHLVILRDGVVEIRTGNAERIRDVSASSLDIGMQTKLDANVISGALGDVTV